MANPATPDVGTYIYTAGQVVVMQETTEQPWGNGGVMLPDGTLIVAMNVALGGGDDLRFFSSEDQGATWTLETPVMTPANGQQILYWDMQLLPDGTIFVVATAGSAEDTCVFRWEAGALTKHGSELGHAWGQLPRVAFTRAEYDTYPTIDDNHSYHGLVVSASTNNTQSVSIEVYGGTADAAGVVSPDNATYIPQQPQIIAQGAEFPHLPRVGVDEIFYKCGAYDTTGAFIVERYYRSAPTTFAKDAAGISTPTSLSLSSNNRLPVAWHDDENDYLYAIFWDATSNTFYPLRQTPASWNTTWTTRTGKVQDGSYTVQESREDRGPIGFVDLVNKKAWVGYGWYNSGGDDQLVWASYSWESDTWSDWSTAQVSAKIEGLLGMSNCTAPNGGSNPGWVVIATDDSAEEYPIWIEAETPVVGSAPEEPTIVASAYAEGTSLSLGGTLTINKPTDTQEGDLMLAFIFQSDFPSLTSTTLPTGWKPAQYWSDTFASGYLWRGWIAYKIAGASEGSSYGFTWTGSNSNNTSCGGAIVTLRGSYDADLRAVAQPVEAIIHGTNGTSHGTVNTVGPMEQNALHFVAMVARVAPTTWTDDAALTEEVNDSMVYVGYEVAGDDTTLGAYTNTVDTSREAGIFQVTVAPQYGASGELVGWGWVPIG